MKPIKILLAMVALLVCAGMARGEQAELPITDMTGGLYSYPSANQIPDNGCSVLENFYTDIERMAVERNGYQKRDSTVLGGGKPVTGNWEFVDTSGNEWQIAFSSRTFYKNINGNTPTAFGPVMTVAQVPDCAVNLGKFWCTNGTDSGWYFDGSATAAVAGMPLGKIIEPWRTRLVVSNITGSQTTMRFSADGDGTSWTLGGNPTDPFSLQIGGANDGYKVNCMWKSYQDNLIVGRKRDMWAVAGFDQLDVEIRNISSEIGCIEPNTLREADGPMIFLSNRGLEEMNGFTIRSISEPVRNITDQIVKNSAQDKSNTQTSDTDFGAGTVTGGVFVSGGSLFPKTTSYSQTAAADWGSATYSGTTLYIDTETNSGSLQTTFPDTFSTYRNGSGGTKHVWNVNDSITPSSSGGLLSLVVPTSQNGNIQSSLPLDGFAKGTTYYVKMNSVTGDGIFDVTLTTISGSGVGGANSFDIRFCSDGSMGSIITNAANVLNNCVCGTTCSGGSLPEEISIFVSTTNYQIRINGSVVKSGAHSWGNDRNPFVFLNIIGGTVQTTVRLDSFGVSPQTFTYTSPPLDSGIVNPIWGAFNGTFGYDNQFDSMTFTTSVSATSGGTYDTAVAVSTGNTITSAAKEFVKIGASFRLNVASGSALHLEDFTFTGGSTGTYKSPVLDLGTAITTFQTFTADQQLNNGTITHEICTSTSSDMKPRSCATQAPNSSITATAQRFAQTSSTFSITASTQAPTLNSYTISWTEGSTPPLASMTYDRRYWLAYTTSTASGASNDRVLVYQRNKTFTLFTGINAGSFGILHDALYFGNSNSNGFVYKFDTGGDDDGANITSRLSTKSFNFGQSVREKDFDQMYVTYLGNAGWSGSFSLGYDLDQAGTIYSLGSASLNEGTGSVLANFPFPLTNAVQGREIQFQFQKVGGQRFKLYEFHPFFDYKEPR